MSLAVTPADAEYLCTVVGVGERGNSDGERCRRGLPPAGSRRCRPFGGCHRDWNVGRRRRRRVVGRRKRQRRLGQRFYCAGRSRSSGTLGCHVGGTGGSARRGWRGAERRGGRGGWAATWVGGPRTATATGEPVRASDCGVHSSCRLRAPWPLRPGRPRRSAQAAAV